MNRFAKLAAVAALSTLALTACQGGGDATTTAPTTTDATSTATSTTTGGAAAYTCPGGKLKGEGSSAQAEAIAEITEAYGDACDGKGVELTYPAGGSGKGITAFKEGQVDFAGSDSALKEEEAAAAKERCKGNDAWNLPMVVGPVAFGYNLPEVKDLVLTPEVLTKIFYGDITTWDDEAIKSLNSGATLPSSPISVFYRSGGSGTSENVSKFLKAASNGAWTDDPSKEWTGKAGEGKATSDEVASAAAATPGSLTYVEYSFTQKHKLGVAKVDNGKGAVALTPETVAKAVDGATIKGTGNDLKLDLKYADTEAGAYPALLVTYEIVCSAGLEADTTEQLKDFLSYFASTEGQSALTDRGYAPLPEELRSKVEKAISEIK